MPTKLPSAGSADVLYLVDLSGYVFRAYHAIRPLSSPKGEPTHATYGTVTMLRRLIDDRKPALLAVAMDSPTPSFRKSLYPEYKANRPPAPEDLKTQMLRCRQIVSASRLPVLQMDGFEADDIIAALVADAHRRSLSVVIVSADKDLMQLVTSHVVLWDTMRNKVYGPPEVQEKLGVPPAKVRDLLSLTGDTSDNIPGVKSVGPKTAAELLTQFGSIDALLASLDQVKNAKLRSVLTDSRDRLLLSRNLVQLRDDILPDVDTCTLRVGEADIEALRQIYLDLGFHRLLDSLPGQVLIPLSSPAGGNIPRDGEIAAPTAESVTAVDKPGELNYRTILSLEELRAAVDTCIQAGRVAIDTETTSTDSMRAALVGMSLSCRPGDAWYIPFVHRYIGAPKQVGIDDARSVLAPVFGSSNVQKVGHNIKFDEVVLRRHGFPRFAPAGFDTMVASYLIDPEASHGLKDLARAILNVEMTTYEQVTQKAKGRQLCFDEVAIEDAAPYAAADADMTLRLSNRFVSQLDAQGLLPLMQDVEAPLLQVLVDLEMAGVLVDVDRLKALGELFDRQLMELEAQAKQQAGRDFNINSPRQLEAILFDELKLKVVKRTRTSRSTDASVLEVLAEQSPLAATVLEQRQLAKLKNTYIDTLPALVNPDTGRIHTHFNQSVAATGRLSSSDPNLQNIPVRTELGRAIREAFVPADGFLLLSADYSQIELRVLAHLAQDPVLIDSFRRGEDIHVRTAMEVFGVSADSVTDEMRRRAKTINFGVIYGMGEVALAKRLDIPRKEAASFIAAYFTRYGHVRDFMERTIESAKAGQAVRTLLGRHRFLRDMHSSNRQLRAQAERIAGNTPIQGSAADILKLAMIRLAEPVVPEARMILTVHDELVFEIPKAHVDTAKDRIRDVMQGVVALDVPLVVDVGVGRNWAEAH